MNNALLFICGLLVAALAALFAVPHFIDWNGYRGVFEEEASRILGREVRVGGSVNVRLLPTPYMRFEKIRLADTMGGTGEPFFRAESFTAWLSVAPLLKGVLEAHEVQLSRPELNVGIDAKGRPSWGTLRVTPGSLPFVPTGVTLHSVSIVDGAVSLHNPEGRQVARVDAINGELSADAIEGPYKFNGMVEWQGGEREVKLVTAAQDPDGGVRFKASVHAPATENQYVFDGRVIDLTTRPTIEGELTAKVAVGKAAAPPEPAPPGGAPGKQAGRKSSAPPNDGPSFELKAKVAGTAAGADIKDITLTFEQGGQPQIVSGEAKALWGAAPRLDVTLASRWLDLDRLAGAAEGAGPLEIARRLATTLAALLPHEAPASVRFAVDQVSLGGEAVSGLKASVDRSYGPLELKELVAGLPGGSRLELSGKLTQADPKAVPGFSGALALRGSSLARFLNWAAKNYALVEGRTDGPFSLQGQLALSDLSVELTEATAELAGTPLAGEVRYHQQEGRQRVALTLEGQEIDPSAFWTRSIGLDDLRTALLGTKLASVEGAHAASRSWFDPGRTDLQVRLRAGQLRLSSNILHDVKADLAVDQGRLTLPALSFATADGLTVEAEGDVAGLGQKPRGRINWLISAPSSGALSDLTRILGSESIAGLGLRTAPVPMRLAGTASFGERTESAVDIDLDGVVQGGRVVGTLRLDGGYENWRTTPAEVSVRVDSPDVARLIASLRARNVASGAPPRGGQMNVNAAGIPERGLLVLAGIESEGLSLGYDGSVTLAGDGVRRLDGRFQITAADAKDVLALAGLSAGGAAGLPLEGMLEVSSNDTAYTLRPRDLTLGGTGIAGEIALARSDEATPVLTADLAVGEASVAGLLSAVLEGGPVAGLEAIAPEGPTAWPTQPFDLSLLDGVSGQLGLNIGTLSLDGPLALTGARLEATLTPTHIKVTRLEGRALGGMLRSTFNVERATAGVGLTGNLRLEGARLDALAAPGSQARASGGPVSASLSFSGRALSPVALISSLRGQGEIEIGPSHLKGLTPRTITSTVEAVLLGKAEASGEGLTKALSEGLRQGELALGPRRVGIALADGALRLEAFAIDTEEGRTRVETTVDLTSLKLDSEWRLEAKARAKGARAPLPPVSVVYVGPLKSLAALEPRISAGSLERELAVRKMEYEVEELERLRKLDEERRLKELERQKALEAERAWSAQAAPSAPTDPAPEKTSPGAENAPVPGSMPSSVGATPLPPIPPATGEQATQVPPPVSGNPPPPPRPSGLTQRQPPKDLSPAEIIKKTFGF